MSIRWARRERRSACKRRWVVGAAVLAAAIGTAQAVWDGSQQIHIGDSVAAEFALGPFVETHRFEFFGPNGATVDATLKVDAGSTIVPQLAMLDQFDDPVNLGGALQGLRIKKFAIPADGRYSLTVQTSQGAGTYGMQTKLKYPKIPKTTVSNGEFDFGAVGGSKVVASVKPGKGSGARPVITSIATATASADIGTGGTKIKSVLPEDGLYTLTYRNDGADGDVVVSLKLTPPRGRGYGFGPIDDPLGLPSTQRDDWLMSAHGDRHAEAFNHWEGTIPTTCAKCHSTPGFRDFVGDDGSAVGVVDQAAAVGTTIECNACHNPAAIALTTVTFPSGAMVEDLGPEARCLQCHQGRESTDSMNTHIAASGAPDDDTVSSSLRFLNVHYFAAGVTLYGGGARGAYQFDGKLYDGKNPHVEAFDTCVECHDPHTQRPKVDQCTVCHPGVADDDSLKTIRMASSVRDYDGDGNVTEGVGQEIEGLQAVLYKAMQDYSLAVSGNMVLYDDHTYPYFFIDTNANRVADEGEVSSTNRFASWTANLLRAAYNFQFSLKDPGAFAHNPKYVIQFMYDSIEALDQHPNVTVAEFPGLFRNDSGHFDGGAEAYRHWDEENDPDGVIDRGTVDAGCARCHSPEGFSFRVQYGIDITVPTQVADGMNCESCHVGGDFADPSPARKYAASVTFPSGKIINNNAADPDDSFLCMQCHQGRESKSSVDARIASNLFGFRNVHYFPAGATLYGKDAEVGYQYRAPDEYAGKWAHADGETAQCTFCHGENHSFEATLSASCTLCHPEAAGNLLNIRKDRPVDYDGNGMTTGQPIRLEVEAFAARLYTSIQGYAAANGGPIIYAGASYPYWFKDTNGNGQVDDGEAVSANSYKAWDAVLMKSTFNYQYFQKEPGAWAHNTFYIMQILYDAIEDTGGSVVGLTRP